MVANVGIKIKGIDELRTEKQEAANAILDEELKATKELRSNLASHILSVFETNKQAKINSGIEQEILDSLNAYNGVYSSEDLARIAEEGGSQIFMNLTATKARAAKSWITDILLPASGKSWAVTSTPLPDLPQDIQNLIDTQVRKEFQEYTKSSAGNLEEAQYSLREQNQAQRDIREAIREEIQKEASDELKAVERRIADQLTEGGWDKALRDFLDDFVIFPAAFLKGPVVYKKPKLTWQNGEPVVTRQYVFDNERVNPLDIYPSPEAVDINDGNLIEHMRLSKAQLYALKGVKHYKDDAIDRVLAKSAQIFIDTGIETEKADSETRDTRVASDSDVIHAYHFFGPVEADLLKEWDPRQFSYLESGTLTEVEAILAGDEVIKCIVNKDPLLRRPYYKASFTNRPGSFWGRGVPLLMKDIQRMCNATARALANNLGIASGPQVEVYVDRLADNAELSDIYPRKIWQVKQDPLGAGGRAVTFFQPSSNARELLEVYTQFEARADDITGIPRFAYMNDKVAGAGVTATGLSMLLESASKIIKDAVRNVDEVIKQRVAYQFYWDMLKNKSSYTGDINIVPLGSSVLTIKGYEAMRRNEFLQITANPTDQSIMGIEGRADILRVAAEDMGFGKNPIPSRLELKKRQREEAAKLAEQQKQEAAAGNAKHQASVEATTIQIEGQKAMHQQSLELRIAELQAKVAEAQKNFELKLAKLEQEKETLALKLQADMQKTAAQLEQKKDQTNKEVAVKLQA